MRVLLVAFSLFFTPPLLAEEKQVEKKEQPETEHNTIFDITQRTVAQTVVSFSETVDSFFGDDRISQEGNTSHLHLSDTFILSENAVGQHAPKIRLRIRLPNSQKRLNLVVDNIVDQFRQDEVNNNLAEGSQGQFADQSLTTALQYSAVAEKKWDVNSKVGLKLKFPLDPFATARARRSFFFGDWEARVSENVFWYRIRGIGQIGRLDFDYNVHEKLLFRFANTESWLKNEDFYRFTHGFFLFQKLNNGRGISYSAFLNSTSDPVVHVESYVLAASYRQNFWREWLYFGVTPQITYPISNNFSSVYSISLTLECFFEKKTKSPSISQLSPQKLPFNHYF